MATPPATPDKMAHPELNGNFAYGNGTSRGSGPPSQPLPTGELDEQLKDWDNDFQSLVQKSYVIKNAVAMAGKCAKLEITLDTNHQRISEIKTYNNKLQQLCEDKDATIDKHEKDLEDAKARLQLQGELEAELEEAKTKINALKLSLKEETKERLVQQKKLEDSGKKLDDKEKQNKVLQERFKKIQGYMQKTKTMPDAELTQNLNAIFKSAFDIVSSCFSEDLDDNVFSSDYWRIFKEKLASDGGGIPLPPSNSPDAKRMRTAAVLRYLALVATPELFQPFYTLERGNELSEALDDRIDDPDHLDLMRRMLLKIEPEQLEDTNVASRVKAVKKCMSDLVYGILTHNAHSFTEALGRWCEETAKVWREELQLLRYAVDPITDLDDSLTLANEWMVLSASADWVTAAAGGGTAGQESPPTIPPNKPLDSLNNVVARIWPVFTTQTGIAKHGLVITKTQVAQAKKEELKFTTQPPNSRRFNRGRQRSMSLSVSSANNVGDSGSSGGSGSPGNPRSNTGSASNAGGSVPSSSRPFLNGPSPAVSGGGG